MLFFYSEFTFTYSVFTTTRKQINDHHTYYTCMTLPRIECEQIDRFKASYSQQFGLDEKIFKVTHHKYLDNIQHALSTVF